jgi:dTDP-4-dehydrorhamnose reductase
MGKNFFTTMMRLGKTHTSINVVDDQFGRPTYAAHLAEASILAGRMLQEKSRPSIKIYHLSDAGPVLSWADFAKLIFEQGQKFLPHPVKVKPILSKDYPTQATRPKYSEMDISQFGEDQNFKIPHWREGLMKAFAVYEADERDRKTLYLTSAPMSQI